MKTIETVACVITFTDRTQVMANVDRDGTVQRWGGPTEDLAAIVDVTERIRGEIIDTTEEALP